MKRRLTLLAAAILTALALTVGGLTARPVAADANGIGISACSYAQSYCHVFFYSAAAGNVTVEWYFKAGQYSAYSANTQYWPAGSSIDATRYFHGDERADQVVVTVPGRMSGLRYYVGW